MSTSPWTAIPSGPPFVLADDFPPIEAFNARCHADHRIELDALPEPFIGPTNAPVVLLSLNPGWNERDCEIHAQTTIAQLLRENLAGESKRFYYFDDALTGSPGADWWRRRLGPLMRAAGADADRRVMVVEWFPYHSRRFSARSPALASQRYSISLVRNAMRRGAWIVSMRAERAWLNSVPELARYERRAKLTNPQNVTVSPGNCVRFEEIVDGLR